MNVKVSWSSSNRRNETVVPIWRSCGQPEHCAVQWLTIDRKPSDLAFLFRLNHLIELRVDFSIDPELIRKLFEELPFLLCFKFKFDEWRASIEIVENSGWIHPKRFEVWLNFESDAEWIDVPDLNAAIQLIMKTVPQ